MCGDYTYEWVFTYDGEVVEGMQSWFSNQDTFRDDGYVLID